MPIKDPEKKRAAQRKADARRGPRARGWACVIYPESASDGWRDALAEQHVQVLVSPLHDADVTADGTPKKPHWHVLAMFEAPATEKAAASLFAVAGVTAPPEMVRSTSIFMVAKRGVPLSSWAARSRANRIRPAQVPSTGMPSTMRVRRSSSISSSASSLP